MVGDGSGSIVRAVAGSNRTAGVVTVARAGGGRDVADM